MTDRLKQLSEAGVSIWLDDLSRERLETGNLADLVKNSFVVGVTTNPSIFASALSEGERYDDQVRRLAADGADVDRTVFELTTTDVRDACDVMRPVWEATGGVDGRVSIEVSPELAHDTKATSAEARRLWDAVDRPNLFVKIPATPDSLPAITDSLAAGINVNVTLIFGLDQYQGVMEAFVSGLEKARANGHDISRIDSVASFFVSRVDTEIDKRLEASGANPQRPLWASTGVKNPDYDDTMYVTQLVVEGTVNTMPEKTLDAVADHGEVRGDRVRPFYDDAHAHMHALAEAGIDYDDVIQVLIKEGVDKFVVAWDELQTTLGASLEAARA